MSVSSTQQELARALRTWLALLVNKGGCHRFVYGQEEDAVFQEDMFTFI
jgi:hypothetical protein